MGYHRCHGEANTVEVEVSDRSLWGETKLRGRDGLPIVDLWDVEPKPVQLAKQLVGGASSILDEVVRSEVDVVGAILEHVVDRRQHRRGDREDGLLGPAARLESEELGLQVRALGASGG